LDPLETEVSELIADGGSGDEYRDESLIAVGGGTASIPNLVTSLIKSIVGSGVLALPAGMAAVGDVPDQVLPISYALFAATAVLNAGFFAVIGTVCGETRSTSFQQCWERSVGPDTSWVVATVIALKTFLSCLAFSIILADSTSSLLGVPRTVALWAVTAFGVLPLALLRDIKSLAPFSALGLAGVAVTGSAMLVRWLDGSYSIDPVDGPLASALPDNLRPEFGHSEGGPHFLQGVVLACSLATAFMAHYNAPRFHAELANNTPERFRIVTGVSYTVSAVVFGLIATAGYMTFGGNSLGV
jgi:amino acid permease